MRPLLVNGDPPGLGFHALHPKTKERLAWVCKIPESTMWRMCNPIPEGVSPEDITADELGTLEGSNLSGYQKLIEASVDLQAILGGSQ